MTPRPAFSDFYEPNINWMDDEEIDTAAMLRDFYPDFHTQGQPDLKKLKEGIVSNIPKAKEFFKCLFKLSHVQRGEAISIENNENLKKISTQFGQGIYAHGVEEAKGGMCNLLMMAISDCIRVPANYWGRFQPGMPNISPLCHGPYYIIFMTNAKQMKTPPNYPDIKAIEYILVPFPENITMLKEKSEELVKARLLDETQHQLFCSRLIDYENLLAKLKNTKDATMVNQERFFTPQKNHSINEICLQGQARYNPGNT